MKKSFLLLLGLPLIISGCTQLSLNQKANNASASSSSSVFVPKEYIGSNNDEKRIASNYIHTIEKIIYANWNVPKNSSNHTANVIFTLDKNGNILNISVNGNDSNLNVSLLHALQKSSSLPSPPLGYYDTFKEMNFSFHAR